MIVLIITLKVVSLQLHKTQDFQPGSVLFPTTVIPRPNSPNKAVLKLFPPTPDDYDFDYTDSGDNGQDFLSSIQSVQDSKLALLGSLAGAKASLFQGLRKAKSSIATGWCPAMRSGRARPRSADAGLM